MGEHTEISWCSHTFNLVWGCTRVSPACDNCYAEAFAKRTGHDVWGKESERRTFGDKHWAEPLKWNDAAEKAGAPALVFCASMADVFEDHPQLPPERDRLWDLIYRTPWLTWQLLTKRPENINRMVPSSWLTDWPVNAWVGTTAENQLYANLRTRRLRAVPARVRFLSCEPLLGPIPQLPLDGISWCIVGGESGPRSRPMDIEWARDIVRQCKEAGVAPFVKQLGSRWPGRQRGDGKGGDIVTFPPGLRVREIPTALPAR